MVAEYTYVLDVTTKEGLTRMRYANLIAFIVLLWARGFHYLWMSYNLFLRYYNDKSWGILYAWTGVFIIFSAFNYLAVILPFYKRTVKWFNKKLPDEPKKQK